MNNWFVGYTHTTYLNWFVITTGSTEWICGTKSRFLNKSFKPLYIYIKKKNKERKNESKNLQNLPENTPTN